MCYSAQIWQSYQKYVRLWGAEISIAEYAELYWRRSQGADVKIAKAMDASFAAPQTDYERMIKSLIEQYDTEQCSKLEQEMLKQRKQLNHAERILQAQTTKKALDDQRIATHKISWLREKLSDLRRSNLIDEDSRIFPGWYAPVMVMANGRRLLRPMRYQCRPAGRPASCDVQYPGTYNARRDELGGRVLERAVRLLPRHRNRERVPRKREPASDGAPLSNGG
jgi:hypothetical protein